MITLLGLGASAGMPAMAPSTASASPLSKEIDGFLLQSPRPSSGDVAAFLKLYSGDSRSAAAQALIARGVSAGTISSALTFLNTSGGLTKNAMYGLLASASALMSGYHGIKRNNGSLGWGLWWFLMGGIFPGATLVVALARKPGFAKPLEK